MDKLSITTHLIAVLTAFSAFTMPIALEVINRVKSHYRSAYYMDALEEIMGFKIRTLFGQLITTLILLLLFSLVVSALPSNHPPKSLILAIEYLFFIVTSVLLVKEYHFIKTILLATRSDDMVTDHLIKKIETNANEDSNYANEVDLLVQIGCYNIEFTETPLGKSIDKRLFEFIESTYMGNNQHVNPTTIEELLTGLASLLTAVRNIDDREKYILLQREYGKHLIYFYDRKKEGAVLFSRIMNNFYEESIKELNSNQYWLLKADFLISIRTWNLVNPYTLGVIDKHIRALIAFLAKEKPELVVSVLDSYRNFNNFDSYLDSKLYNLSHLGGEYSTYGFDEIHNFTKNHHSLLLSAPHEYAAELVLLIDKVTQEKLKTSPTARQKIKEEVTEFEEDIMHEMIKMLGNRYSERSAQEAIRTLAFHRNWHSILDCYNSFSPASSQIIRVGHALLTASINSYIDELGKSEFEGMFDREGYNHAYLKAVPLLIMLTVYNWRQRNFNTSMDDAIHDLSANFKLLERTISKAKEVQKDIDKVLYFADSSIYAKSFCSYFGIEHEQELFKETSIRVLKEIDSFAKREQETLYRKQPLSDSIKKRFKEEIRQDASNGLESYPLFHNYQITSTKRPNPQRYKIEESRDAFLDNTGTHHIFNGLGRLELLHSKLANTLISNKGKPIRNLQLNDLKSNEVLIITTKDWESATASLDLTKIDSVNRKLIFTDSPLHKYYIHNADNPKPYVTLFNSKTDAEPTMETAFENSIEFQFIDEEVKVIIELEYHIYANEDEIKPD